MTKSSAKQKLLELTFLELYSILELNNQEFSVRLIVDSDASLDSSGQESSRSFAYCESNDPGKPITIAVSPRLMNQSQSRINGVLMHEFGHAVLFSRGVLKHSEREADLVAEDEFDRPIYYDKDDVQTDNHGMRPRPAYLDNNQCKKHK